MYICCVIKCTTSIKCSLSNSSELGIGQSQNTDDAIRYETIGGTRKVSLDAKIVDPLLYDDPLGDFGEKGPPKEAASTATAPTYD